MWPLAKKVSVNLLPYLFIFIASLYRPWDADLGWHLKYGEYFFQTGSILKENTFSTEMSEFIWANTSWGIDLIYYLTYNSLGFLGLTLLGSLVITLTFFFFSRAFNLNYWQQAIIFPLLVILEEPVNQISFRGQVLSVMMLGLLVWILNAYERSGSKKVLLLCAPLFLFWANLHGQFILGFGILVLWIFFYILRLFIEENPELKFSSLLSSLNNFIKSNFSQIRFLIATVLITFLATLIHPFGFGIYTDAFLHFRNTDLQYIIEYLPFEDLTQPWWNQMIFGILIFLGIVYVFFNGDFKKRISDLGVLAVLYSLSWWVRRYAWSMYYLGIPFLKPIADFVKPDTEKITQRVAVILFVLYLIVTISIKMPFDQYTKMNWEIFCTDFNHCSRQLPEYIIENNLTSNLLTYYNWGGFLIWNYPNLKPSIDGRMHLWKDDQGYSAFSHYYAYEQNWEEIDYSTYDVVLIGNDKPLFDRLEELAEEGRWEKRIEDEYGAVFTRVKESTASSEFILQ